MVQFMVDNWRTLLMIYLIGAGVVFVAFCLFWAWVARSEARDRKLYPEQYDTDEDGGWTLFAAIGIIMALLMAVLWIGIPVILAGVMVMDWIQRKFPKLMGDMCEDKEEDDD